MNEQYLFRGKDMHDGEWIEDCLSWEYIDGKMCVTVENPSNKFWANVDPATVGRCTGLKDKNSKLIFEEDVVRGNDGIVYHIVWNSFKAQFQGKVLQCPNGLYENGCRFMISQDSGDGLEVIGNGHDNPELLEAEKK